MDRRARAGRKFVDDCDQLASNFCLSLVKDTIKLDFIQKVTLRHQLYNIALFLQLRNFTAS